MERFYIFSLLHSPMNCGKGEIKLATLLKFDVAYTVRNLNL